MSGFIGALIGVIIVLIVMGVCWWAITQLLPLLPLPSPFAQIINVLLRVILVLIVLWVILMLLGAAGVHIPFLHTASLASRPFAAISIRPAVYL